MFNYFTRLKRIKDNLYRDYFLSRKVEILFDEKHEFLSNIHHENILNIKFYGKGTDNKKFYAREYEDISFINKDQLKEIKNNIRQFFSYLGKSVILSKNTYGGKFKIVDIKDSSDINSFIRATYLRGYKKIIRNNFYEFVSLLNREKNITLYGEKSSDTNDFIMEIINFLQFNNKIVFYFDSPEKFYEEAYNFLILGENYEIKTDKEKILKILDTEEAYIFFKINEPKIIPQQWNTMENSLSKTHKIIVSEKVFKREGYAQYHLMPLREEEVKEMFFWSNPDIISKLFYESNKDINTIKTKLFFRNPPELSFNEKYYVNYFFLLEKYPSKANKNQIEKIEKNKELLNSLIDKYLDERILKTILKNFRGKTLAINEYKMGLLIENIKNSILLGKIYTFLPQNLKEKFFYILNSIRIEDKDLREIAFNFKEHPFYKMKILEKIKVKNEKEVKELFDLYVKNSEYEKAINWSKKHQSLFTTKKELIKKLKCFRILGQEKEFFRELKKFKEQNKNEEIYYQALFEEGLLYYTKGELAKAQKVFENIMNNSGESSLITKTKRYIFYLKKKRGKGNIEELFELYMLKVKDNDYLDLGNISSDIGQNYFKNEQLYQALSWFELSEYFFRKIDNKKAYTLSIFNRGEVLKEMGELEKAEELIKKALEYDESVGNKISKIVDIFSLGEISFLKGEYEKTYERLNKVLKEREIENMENKIPLFRILYNFVALFIPSHEQRRKYKFFDFFNNLDFPKWKKIVKNFSANFFDELKILIIYIHIVKKKEQELNQKILDFYLKKIKEKNLIFYLKIFEKILKGESLRDLTNYREKRKPSDFEIVGFDSGLSNIKEFIDKIKNLPFSVLITGESGTGKELIARYLHFNSIRRDNPFVVVNCAAIPKELMESLFFGYKKGSFTGALKDSKGFIESANNGTLFLDEIGELPLNIQSKLLRVIQEKEIVEIGSTKTKKVDVRFIFATNRNLEKEMESGNFRRDLFYRINEIKVELPPLRKRKEDIPLLVSFFLRKYEKFIGKKGIGISSNVMKALTNYDWPGNVRELEVEIKKAIVLLSENEFILNKKHFDKKFFDKEDIFEVLPLKKIKEDAEKEYLSRVLNSFKTLTRDEMAKKLGISRMQLYNLLKKYDMGQ